jgi:hypothetical protein
VLYGVVGLAEQLAFDLVEIHALTTRERGDGGLCTRQAVALAVID